MKKVNNVLAADLPLARFITLIYAVIDPAAKTITMANAGHQHPVFCTNSKTESVVIESGIPLGIKEFEYKEYSFPMNSGEKIFLFSDGVTEAMDKSQNLFGEERIIQSLKNQKSNVESLYSDVKTFINGNPLSDDLTIVIIEAL